MKNVPLFADLVFGGVAKAKQLFVDDLKERRIAKGLTAEEIDDQIDRGDDWVTIREIEEDPNLLSGIHVFALVGKGDFLSLSTEGVRVNEAIQRYLEDPSNLDFTVQRFLNQDRIRIEGVMYKGENSESEMKVPRNMVAPKVYAQFFIYACIAREF